MLMFRKTVFVIALLFLVVCFAQAKEGKRVYQVVLSPEQVDKVQGLQPGPFPALLMGEQDKDERWKGVSEKSVVVNKDSQGNLVVSFLLEKAPGPYSMLALDLGGGRDFELGLVNSDENILISQGSFPGEVVPIEFAKFKPKDYKPLHDHFRAKPGFGTLFVQHALPIGAQVGLGFATGGASVPFSITNWFVSFARNKVTAGQRDFMALRGNGSFAVQHFLQVENKKLSVLGSTVTQQELRIRALETEIADIKRGMIQPPATVAVPEEDAETKALRLALTPTTSDHQ